MMMKESLLRNRFLTGTITKDFNREEIRLSEVAAFVLAMSCQTDAFMRASLEKCFCMFHNKFIHSLYFFYTCICLKKIVWHIRREPFVLFLCYRLSKCIKKNGSPSVCQSVSPSHLGGFEFCSQDVLILLGDLNFGQDVLILLGIVFFSYEVNFSAVLVNRGDMFVVFQDDHCAKLSYWHIICT